MSGLLVIISSPSGGGKTSVIKELLKNPQMEFVYSVSATTRKPRRGEVNGKDYIFLSEKEFRDKIEQDEFIEWERVHDYFYGTLKQPIQNWLHRQKKVLLDIDVNGGLKVKNQYAKQAVTIFIEPPSLDELIVRLKNRKSDSSAEITKRLKRVPLEIEKKDEFDFIVVNDRLDQTIQQVLNIINNYEH